MNDKVKDILDKAKKLLPIWDKYKKYVITLGLFAMVMVTLYFFTGEDYIAKRLEAINNRPVSGEDYVPDKNFEIDAYEGVNELISTYFEAYVNADFDTLTQIANPMSEMEQSYIDVMTQYYEEFRNIKCYTKHGLSKNSFIVSAYYEIKFVDIEELAPSLVLFYVQTNEDGELYINNLYSDFNRRYRENVVNKDVNTAFIKYTTQDDYIALHHQVDNAFKELIMENEDIYILTKRTIPALRQEWEDTVYYVHNDEPESETGTEPDSGWIDGVEPGTTEVPTDSQEPATTAPVTPEPSTTEPTPSETESQEPAVERVKVLMNNVNVRKKATTSSSSLGKVDKGEIFEVKERVTGSSDGKIWVKIDYNGKTGYIRSDFLEEVTE
ncbi:MAG: SH3 domain-containing protein [Lachnospiraceae bacterium]|nr:SH3 domain-containing protein [Lachnospiraceae bacterium]